MKIFFSLLIFFIFSFSHFSFSCEIEEKKLGSYFSNEELNDFKKSITKNNNENLYQFPAYLKCKEENLLHNSFVSYIVENNNLLQITLEQSGLDEAVILKYFYTKYKDRVPIKNFNNKLFGQSLFWETGNRQFNYISFTDRNNKKEVITITPLDQKLRSQIYKIFEAKKE